MSDAVTEAMTSIGGVRIVGRGRMGRALEARLREAGLTVELLSGRAVAAGAEAMAGADVGDRVEHADGAEYSAGGGAGADTGLTAVLLAVPDAAIAAVAARVPPGTPVGHCSGAASLEALAGHPHAFSLHPLQTVVGAATRFDGSYAAIDATTPTAGDIAHTLASALGLRPITISGADRPAYHAAASIASNFLVTLEAFAERLAETVGVPRGALAPLARASLENWVTLGAAALTGPIARGDEETVAKQRAAVAHGLPDDLALFDALTRATRALAHPDSLEVDDRTDSSEEPSTR